MILLFFLSLFIASKWKGSLTKCGFIGMAIYVLFSAMAASTNLQFQYGSDGGFVYGLILASIYSIFLIWIPVWIIMAGRRRKRVDQAEAKEIAEHGDPRNAWKKFFNWDIKR
jgi:hypothetical protein